MLSLEAGSRILLYAGVAAALAALGLVLTDVAVLVPAAQAPLLLIALLITLPLGIGLSGLLMPTAHAAAQAKAFAGLGILLWLGGIGADVFNSSATASAGFLPGFHVSAAIGGFALAAAGLRSTPPRTNRADRRRQERERRVARP